MVVSKYKFKPIDVALMFLNADFTRNQENEIITDIFSNYNSDIVAEYRKDINKFRKAIREYAIMKLSILLDNFFSKIFEMFLNVKLWCQSFKSSLVNL